MLLDGFDLGVGILFPFAPSEDCRNKMINSIAPFWDGNETWLVLGGGGLFAAFPLAYSIILPAVYLPVIFMLIALVFRGVAFEFRFKATEKTRKVWDVSFHFGSLVAAFMQGVILGTFVKGIPVENSEYAGNAFGWLTPFSITTGIAVIFGYVLLGSSWLILKTEDQTQAWGQKTAKYALLYVVFFMGLVCLWMPLIEDEILHRWINWPDTAYLIAIPIITLLTVIALYRAITHNKEVKPFLLTILLFILGFIGLAINLWPYVVPRALTLQQAAAAPESQTLILIGVIIVLPVILAYTAYSYYVFRGKVKSDAMY